MTEHALAALAKRWEVGDTLRHEDDELIKALMASRATVTQALRAFVDWHGGAHAADCPEDDTCDCAGAALNAQVNAALRDDTDLLANQQRERVFIAGWDAGFQEAQRPDSWPHQNRCEVAYQAWLQRARVVSR